MCGDVWEDEQLEPWQRQSGVHRLSRRELATLQKLAAWREEEAAARNRPPRRILRDDLLMDLAKRRPATDFQQALATRDLNRPEYKRVLPEMIQVIAEAGRIPEDRLPPRERQRDDASSDDQIISRLLGLRSATSAEQDVAQTWPRTDRDPD
ncbi:MAG UNVERIFIED_CONTAM: HRDC domain-containing protein [Planctomycetaceae bacterium]